MKEKPYVMIRACINIIRQYIRDQKGVIINIIPPRNKREEELFIVALDKALIYYGLEL